MKTKIHKTLTLALCTVAFSISTNAQFPDFISIDTGAIHASSGHHISSGWFDMDNDGYMDVVITNTSGMGYQNHPNLLYKNEGDGHFMQVTDTEYTLQKLNVGLPGPFGDIDNDGDEDLMNPNWMGTQYYLYKNDGFGNFENFQTLTQLFGATSVLFDLNNDSFLDAVLFHQDISRAYYNDGTGEFSGFENLNIPCSDPNAILHNIAMGDADNDGNFDLYIAYSSLEGGLGAAKNECYLNKGSGVFEKINDDNLIVQDIAMCPNANWVDYDNDGDMDLYVLNTFNSVSPSQSVSGALFENKGEMVFEKHIIEPEEYKDCHRISSVWGDLDNDADLDLYITIEKNNFNSHVSPIKHNLLLLNDGNGQFTELSDHLLVDESSHTATFEDIDNDGDLDILLVRFSWANNGRNSLCMNEGNDNSWINITCEGTTSNKTSIGTRVIAKATVNNVVVSQIREITPMSGHCTYPSTRVHFGLGDADVIDTLIIRWPSGHIDQYFNVAANEFYRVIEAEGILGHIEFKTPSAEQNIIIYPNPFTTSTTIEYELQQPSTVEITIYNHLGKQIEVIEQKQSTGKQQVVWDAEGLPSGVYFCVLKTESGMETMKMIKL